MSTIEPSFYVVIPARYASTRLPGKPLIPIAGKAMILHVCDRALESNADRVVVATDDERVYRTVSDAGFDSIMTSPHHESGTDRLAEVVDISGWPDSTIIVNVQGDEPLISPSSINTVADALMNDDKAPVSTLATPICKSDEIFDPNVVKVVTDRFGYALYFSRAVIPWDREKFHSGQKFDISILESTYRRHLGIYGYRAEFLRRFVNWSPCTIESTEKLEQLRILWNSERILVKTIAKAPHPGIDTQADIKRVEKLITDNKFMDDLT